MTLEEFTNLVRDHSSGPSMLAVAARAFLAAIEAEDTEGALRELRDAVLDTNLSNDRRAMALMFGTIILLDQRG